MGMLASERDADEASVASDSRVRPVTLVVLLWLLSTGAYGILTATTDRTVMMEAIRQLAYLLPFYLAAVSALVVYRIAGVRERPLWRGLTISLVLITVGETYTSVGVASGSTITGGWTVLPLATGAVAALLLISSLFRMTDFRTLARAAGARHLLDALGAALLCFGLVLLLLAGPVEAVYPGFESSAAVVAAIFSMLGILILIATAVNFATRGWSHWRESERRVITGIGVYGLATALWPLWWFGAVVHPSVPSDHLIEVMWMTGAFMVAGGTITRLRLATGSVRFLTLPRSRPRKHGGLSITMPTLFVGATLLFGYLSVRGAFDAPTNIAFGSASLGLAFVVAGRSAVSALENEFLYDKAVNDPLTDLFGHRFFHERLQIELDMAGRRSGCVTVIAVDLDGFSRVNRSRGHAFGDDVLRASADALVCSCRASDIVCRLGADEFALILPDATEDDMSAVIRRIRTALAEVDQGDADPLTASLGIAAYPRHGSERDDLIRKAEGALYWAKYHGKDRAVVFDESVVDSLDANDRIRQLEQQAHLGTVRALAAAVDARDPLTQFHSRNVAGLVVMLAEEIGIDEDRRELMEIAALLHDVGKIGISDKVLRKRGPLNAVEMRHIREHPGLGEKILRSTQLEEILPWVRHHHERWDGAGYPDGQAGEDIPLEARMLCICDSYDAMTSGRPYRSALSSTAALQELDLCIGTQFDPVLAEAFIRMVGRRRLLRPETISAREESAS